MPAEPNLRHLFDDARAPASRIDTRAVIRRSRARRLPMQLAGGGVVALAVGGVAVLGFQGITALAPTAVSDSALMSDEGTAYDREDVDGGVEVFSWSAPAEKLNLCGGPLAEIAPSATGLVLTADFPDATAGSSIVEGTVTLTNTGTEVVVGVTSAAPAVTLSSGGTVLWHSNGPTTTQAREVTLAPGESLDYAATLVPVLCGTEDELRESFRAGLPPLPAGDYEVSAAIELIGGDSNELVTGPAATVTLR